MAIVHHDKIFSTKAGLEFFDALDVDDAGTMYADETFRVESLLEITDRFSDEVGLFASVQLEIVSRCFYPSDLIGLQEDNPPSGLDGEPV